MYLFSLLPRLLKLEQGVVQQPLRRDQSVRRLPSRGGALPALHVSRAHQGRGREPLPQRAEI